MSGELDGKAGGESADLADGNLRRTVYVRVGRYQQNETLALFDFPSTSIHVEQRGVTNVPLQKLFFLNSSFLRLWGRRRWRSGWSVWGRLMRNGWQLFTGCCFSGRRAGGE